VALRHEHSLAASRYRLLALIRQLRGALEARLASIGAA
jgi:hypothetical protein